jgi:hypothetical protein
MIKKKNPLASQTQRKSWVYRHGYRVALLADPTKIFFVCRYCHQRGYTNTRRGGVYITTDSTSTAARHLKQTRPGHNLVAPGRAVRATVTTSSWLRQAFKSGYTVPQSLANVAGSFDVHAFRFTAVSWLVENNHSLREFETESFRVLIKAANPEAAASLWASRTSVSRYVLRLYDFIKPIVVTELSRSLSKIHISFDGWTTKGGKQGYLGLVAHFVNHAGDLIDLPIALPQLIGAHSGDNIAQVVLKVFKNFSILSSQVGYFVLDNAANDDTAIAVLGDALGFDPIKRRLRCAPHTINLVGQTLLWGDNKDAYDNNQDNLQVC